MVLVSVLHAVVPCAFSIFSTSFFRGYTLVLPASSVPRPGDEVRPGLSTAR